MTLRDQLASLVAALPEGASVTIPADALRTWLAADECHSGHPSASAGHSVDCTVAQVAAQFGKGESTVRTWLARGELPGAYKLHGAEWRIPPAAIEAMQERQREQHTTPKPRTTGKTADIGEWRKHTKGAA